MELSKGLAILVSIFFFLGLVVILVVFAVGFFPDFSFSENPIIRLVVLLVFVYITKRFYIYLRGESYNKSLKEGSHNSDNDLKKREDYPDMADSSENKPNPRISAGVKIAIALISIVVIVFVSLITVGMFVSDDTADPVVFSNNNISFEYPGDLERVNDKNYTFLAQGVDVSLTMSTVNSEGATIDQIIEELKKEAAKDSNTDIYSVNKTFVDSVEAYDMNVNVKDDNQLYSKSLLFVHNNNIYIFKFEAEQSTEVNNIFNSVKNSIKLKQ